MMDGRESTQSAARSVRVRRIKRIIIAAVVTLIVLPMILCIFLLRRVHVLEQQVQELYETRAAETLMAVELEEKTAPMEMTVADYTEPETQEPEQQEPIIVDELQHEKWPRKVYLTFDDGPSYYTDDILDILNRYGVKANFFVIGTEDPELRKMYRRIIEEGHVLGMHSYSHKYQDIYASVDAFATDLSRLETLLYDETGVIPKLYRFPGGSSNTVSPVSMGYFIDYLTAKGITYYDWNISSGDASTHLLPKDDIVRNSLYRIDENEETMILLHDIGDKSTTVEALPEIIEALQEQELPIVTIDDTTMPIQHILE
ncbi:MAG: polysaccharide deacetylase family protein [bacterium]|nr:polysaccharide deacetylase family protein [bacterium]